MLTTKRRGCIISGVGITTPIGAGLLTLMLFFEKILFFPTLCSAIARIVLSVTVMRMVLRKNLATLPLLSSAKILIVKTTQLLDTTVSAIRSENS